VRNANEAAQALAAGADIIDLKDPDSGALGALNAEDTRQVLQMVNGRVPVSATVGEDHHTLDALLDPIRLRIALGVDVVKISVSDLFYRDDFMHEVSSLASGQTRLVAVFFADSEPDFGLLPRLHQAGCWGAMLDTRYKHKNLLQNRTSDYLRHFIALCGQYGLETGLAGSLQPQDIDKLAKINATYLGFRGGVCENSSRIQSLSRIKVEAVANMLRQHNMGAATGYRL
jgi:dihydroneopterin aldolase